MGGPFPVGLIITYRRQGAKIKMLEEFTMKKSISSNLVEFDVQLPISIIKKLEARAAEEGVSTDDIICKVLSAAEVAAQ